MHGGFRNGAGRPKTPIDKTQLENVMRLYPTKEEAAAFFKCTPETLLRFIKKEFGLDFVTFREQNLAHSRLNLKRVALREATKERPNTAMLIFCLKNMCGWSDNVEDQKPLDEDARKFILAYEVKKKDANK